MMRTTTLPFFQVDSGQLLMEGMGRSLEEMGLYVMLQALYWENGCRLHPIDTLALKLNLKSPRKRAFLEEVARAFFPEGRHAHLDQCKAIALKTSMRNSENAKKGHAQRGNLGKSSETSRGGAGGAEDF